MTINNDRFRDEDKAAQEEFILWPEEARQKGFKGEAAERYVRYRKNGCGPGLAEILTAKVAPAGDVKGSPYKCPKRKMS